MKTRSVQGDRLRFRLNRCKTFPPSLTQMPNSTKPKSPIPFCLAITIACSFFTVYYFSTSSRVSVITSQFSLDKSNSNPPPTQFSRLHSGSKQQKPKGKFHICQRKEAISCRRQISRVIARWMTSKKYSSFRIDGNDTLIVRDRKKLKGEKKVQDWDIGLEDAIHIEGRYRKIRVKIVEAFHYRSNRWASEGYSDIENYVNVSDHRLPGIALFPRKCSNDVLSQPVPWLAQFRNAFVNHDGVIIVPFRKGNTENHYDARSYDIAGGCCEKDWRNTRGASISISFESVDRALFSTGNYHGSTFHHVITEQVPRLLAFWKLLQKDRNVKVTVRGGVLQDLLDVFGWSKERITSKPRRIDYWAAEKIYMPAPYYQDREGYSNCSEWITSNIFKHLVRDRKVRRRQKLIILVLDRAEHRTKGTKQSCLGKRCIRNLPELVQKLRKEFRHRAYVRVMRHNEGNTLIDGVAQFKHSKLVIGAHGAGFQNLMFMKSGSTAIHMGWKWEIYAKLAERHKISFKQVGIRGMSHNSGNHTADIAKVMQIVHKTLSNDLRNT